MVFTDGDGGLLFCSPTQIGSCADITHARELGLVKLLADGPAVEILAHAGYQSGRVPGPYRTSSARSLERLPVPRTQRGWVPTELAPFLPLLPVRRRTVTAYACGDLAW